MRKEEKIEASELRKQGKSYNEITNILKISKSTLSTWFSREKWSGIIANKNTIKNSGKDRIIIMNAARSLKLEKHYEEAKIEALDLFNKYNSEPLFISGLMLYIGEGDKSLKNNMVRLSNIDFGTVKIFKLFLEKYFSELKGKIRFWVLLYPDLIPSVCEDKWCSELELSREKLYKYQVIQGKHKSKRLIYGVGNIIIGCKYLKVVILELIRLTTKELLK